MNTQCAPRIAIFLDGTKENPVKTRISSLTAEVAAALAEFGAQVELINPACEAIDIAALRPTHDLYVLKEKTSLNVSVAKVLSLSGARVVNSVRASTLARDKIAATALVAAAGVPVPPSWATGKLQRLDALLADGPLWLKPQRGSRGFGVRRVAHAAELGGAAVADSFGLPLPLFAQREVPTDGDDFKVYVVGDKVWALRRVFPALTIEQKLGHRVAVPSAIKEAALACGAALGLELYGVDFLLRDGSFFVVDVNAFPGYKGITEAPATIANYLYQQALVEAQRCERGEYAPTHAQEIEL